MREQQSGKSEPKSKIIISVFGGVVQDVFCSEAEADVTVVDWDATGYSEGGEGYVTVPDKFGKASPAAVSQTLAEPLRAISGTPIQLALERAGVLYGGAQNGSASDSPPPIAEGDRRCDCERPGVSRSGVPGIIARIENGRLAAGATVERCDACERFPTDTAALAELRRRGMA